jgi:hypothetical protein
MLHYLKVIILTFLLSIVVYGQNQDLNVGKNSLQYSPFPSFTSNTIASWVSLPNSPSAVSRSCCALVNINGADYLYQFGGGNTSGELRRVSRLNLTNNNWQNNVSTMPNMISSGTAVAMRGDSMIYVFGGNSTILGKTLRYNVYTNTWTAMADMPTKVTDALVLKYNESLILVIGGGDGYFGSTAFITNKVQVYNINTNSYTTVNNFPINCAMQGGGLYRDTVISVGGYTDGGNATANCYKGIINPSNLNITWTPIPSYPTGPILRMASHIAVKNEGLGVLCTGGAINGSTPTAQSYFWNFCTQQWQNSIPDISLARSNFKATGRDNVIYMAAGYTNVGVGNTEELTFTYIDGPCTNLTGLNNNGIPSEFTLKQNYPNPFNPSTMISFSLPQTGIVKVIITDISGKELNVIGAKQYSAGIHEIAFNGSNLASGIYFYKVEFSDNSGNLLNSGTKKMVLIK